MLDIALEVPLAAFDFGGFSGAITRAARIGVFHIALDGAALAGGIATFKQNHNALAGFFHPVLHLEQFNLLVLVLPLVIVRRMRVLWGSRPAAGRTAVFVAAVRGGGHLDGDGRLADGADFFGGVFLLLVRLVRLWLVTGDECAQPSR